MHFLNNSIDRHQRIKYEKAKKLILHNIGIPH